MDPRRKNTCSTSIAVCYTGSNLISHDRKRAIRLVFAEDGHGPNCRRGLFRPVGVTMAGERERSCVAARIVDKTAWLTDTSNPS